MIYFRYPLDIHRWKIKPETEPDRFRGPESKNCGEKSSPNPNPRDPKPADIRLKTAPLPSLSETLAKTHEKHLKTIANYATFR
jgi:hypothetical protein